MTKNVWVQPQTVVQQFVANEYVASSCQEAGASYLFTCNAGGGVYGSVYEESNGVPGLQTGRGGDTELAGYSDGWLGESGYHACQRTHEADSSNEFVPGYYCPKGNISSAMDVIVWKEPRGWGRPDNIHCTTELDMTKWDKTFS